MAVDPGIGAAEPGGFKFVLPADDLGIVSVARRFERAVLLQRLDDHARAGLGFEPSVLGRQHFDPLKRRSPA